MRILLSRILLALALFLPISESHAAQFTVTKTNDTNDGVCDTDCSLREAITAANASSDMDVITLPAGEYVIAIAGADENLNATGDFDIKSDLMLQGSDAATTIIDGGPGTNQVTDRVFQILSGNVNLDKITIRNGNSGTNHGGGIFYSGTQTLMLSNVNISSNSTEGQGGGLFMNAGTLQCQNVTFEKNLAKQGGAGLTFSGSVAATITNSVITGNQSEQGSGAGILIGSTGNMTLDNVDVENNTGVSGAVYKVGSGSFNVQNSSFRNNQASEDAGGLYISSGSAVFTRSTIENNQAAKNTGGLYFGANGKTLTLTECSISRNTATGGVAGGMELQNTNLVMEKSVVDHNSSSASGGGIYYNDGTLTLSNSTLSHNSAEESGGALAGQGSATLKNVTIAYNTSTTVAGIDSNDGEVSLTNTLIVKNTGTLDCQGKISSRGHNMEDGDDCDLKKNDFPNTEAEIATELENHDGPTLTLALLPLSAAIDSGSLEDCPRDDQRGQARPADGDNDGTARCDIGAYEMSTCGDGILNPGEVCDDGNNDDKDSCTHFCVPPGCGDTLLEDSEVCDDGNKRGGDGCSADCKKIEVCGDGVKDANEECDAGDSTFLVDCSSVCTKIDCGDVCGETIGPPTPPPEPLPSNNPSATSGSSTNDSGSGCQLTTAKQHHRKTFVWVLMGVLWAYRLHITRRKCK